MSPTQALLWKEWTEHRWKLAFGTVMLASFAGALFAWGGISNRELIILVLFIGCLVLSLFNAMGTFAEEHGEGTALFLAARPIEAWRVFLGKWLIGWINAVVPLLACGLTMGVWFGSSAHSGPVVHGLVRGTLAIAWIATALYSLTCCVTLRGGGPAAVGLGGLLWAGAMALHAFLLEALSAPASPAPSLMHTLASYVNPVFVLALVDPPPLLKNASWLPFAVGIAEQGIVLSVVLWIGLRNWRRSV